MRLGSLIMALVGLGVAGGSVIAARQYIGFEAEQVENSGPKIVRVIAAAQDIPFGTEIEGQMLTTIEWPEASVPPGVFTSYEDILGGADLEPRRARRPLAQGELVLASKVSDFGEKITIVQTLGDNTRAMAIEVSASTAVGGFVTPGDKVDIVMTQGGGDDMRTVTILQNIRVVGVDQQSDEQIDQPGVARTVTVEVTPVQGQKLALAQRAGELSLSLRSQVNAADEPLESIKLSDLLREKSPLPDEAPSPTIRVRRGTDAVSEVEVK